jgi:AraC-like DNA-binding protein
MTDIPMIRSAVLTHYAPLAASLGIDIIKMLQQSGLDRRCLIDPDMLVPVARASALIELTAVAAGSQTFGIELSLGRGTPDIGPLNLLLREEPDLGCALRSMEHYLYVHSVAMAFALEEIDGLAFVKVRFPDERGAPQALEAAVCGVLQSIRWLAGADLTPVLVAFSHNRPSDIRKHRALLKCSVDFDQDFDGIVLTAEQLARTNGNANPSLRRHAEDYVLSLRGGATVTDEAAVRRLIGALLPTGRCSAAAVAAQIGIDRTTMARRLARTETSYSQILQDERMEEAKRTCLLGWPLTRIADRIGFADLSTFSRWFSRSFGCAPSQWRKPPQ